MNTPADGVGRTMAVLRALALHEPKGSSTSEVARDTGLARPTAHRILSALNERGLADRDETGRWLLGPELYLLGSTAARRYDVTAMAGPIVRQLAIASSESAFLSARRGDETVCLIREDGSFPVRSHVLYEGVRFPLGVASAGLAILAYLPNAEIDEYLNRADLTGDYGQSHNAENLRRRLSDTRKLGYALNPGLIVEGSWGIGAAVFDATGAPRWALTLTGIEQRFSTERRATLGSMLLRAAHELTRTMMRHR